MPATIIEVTAASRLHFGLLSFGHPRTRQFGGLGAMVSQPALRLRISPSDRFEALGPLADRVQKAVERVSRLLLLPMPACRMEIDSGPPQHVGLGTGTQVALAAVAGINALRGGESLGAFGLAMSAGRGLRSAIGTHGFLHGGLLVELGKHENQLLSPLEKRVELPSAWRFVLICPLHPPGLSGDAEQSAFRDLPAVPRSTTANLLREVSDEMLPAAAAGQFERFSESLYRYGHAAGMCFAAKQGGPFASPQIEKLIATIRSLGVRGVGQSSWGPTVFALLPRAAEAAEFAERARPHLTSDDRIIVTEPNNQGTRITRHQQP